MTLRSLPDTRPDVQPDTEPAQRDVVLPETATVPGPRSSRAGDEQRDTRSSRTSRLLTDRARATGPDDEQRRASLLEQVVVLNMPVARSIAARYRGRGVPDEDLVQVAYLALVKAAQRFDPLLRHDFLSYAVPTIRGEVKRWFRDRGWTVRPPRRVQELQQAVFRTDAQLSQSLGRPPRHDEVAAHLGVGVEQVREALSTDGAFTPLSLDVPVTEDGFATVGDTLARPEDSSTDAADARLMVGPAVRELGDRDRAIIAMRFEGGRTQQEIADVLGVTQMQVSRLLSRILRTLRTRIGDDQSVAS